MTVTVGTGAGPAPLEHAAVNPISATAATVRIRTFRIRCRIAAP
ncbi:hypothetical protein ACIRVK_43540 [Streptomyces sp. NPDC101152]